MENMAASKLHQQRGLDRGLLALGAVSSLLVALPAIALLRFPELHVFRDFHEHVAVVKALSLDLLKPAHPMLRDALPHGWFSPYAWLVAAISRYADCDPARALLGMGVLNTLLVISGFAAFLRSIGERRYGVLSLTLAILFFGWSSDAPLWSGFLNIRMHAVVASYPATFAIGLGWWLLALVLCSPRGGALSGLGAGLGLLWLIHPSTAMSVSWGGLLLFVRGAVTADSDRPEDRCPAKALRWSFWLLPPAVLICLTWPFYPWLELVRGDRAHFNHDSRLLYQGSFAWLLPLAAGLPFLVRRFRRSRLDPLVILFAGWSIIYIIGGLTGAFGIGRSVAFAAMALQLATALELPGAWSRAGFRLILGVAGLGVALPAAELGWKLVVHPRLADPAESLEFLKAHVNPDDLVLSDLLTSFRVPAVSGKVLASFHPLYFVPDHEERRQQLKRLFSGAASESELQTLLRASRARFILIPLRRVTPRTAALLQRAGKIIHQTPRYQLIEVPGGER